jgi:hypothetical protein
MHTKRVSEFNVEFRYYVPFSVHRAILRESSNIKSTDPSMKESIMLVNTATVAKYSRRGGSQS